jgi:flagellar basal-body rod modification protein FlgD
MSAVNGVSSGTSNTLSGSSADSLGSITQSEFLQLLLTELQNQNPLDPMSDTDFATQLATLTEVDSIDSMSTNFGNLLQVQQLSGPSSLIGLTATYTPSDSSSTAQGTVTGMSVQSDGSVDLTVNGTNVPLSQVDSIN